jgi:hypothetical protein
MKTRLWVVLIVFVLMCGCGTSDESKIATAVYQTMQVELQPTTTPHPISVSTQTPKPTLTKNPTDEPPPTIVMDLSPITLTQQDLSDDFYAIPSFMVGISKSTIQNWYSETDIEVVDAFFFTDDREERYIIGWIIHLPERLERTGFDTVMRHHEYVLVKAVAELGGEEILQRDLLEIEADLGNDSQGLRLLVKEEGGPYQFWVDAILFERDFMGVTAFEAYEDWMEPLMGIENIASNLDRKILEVLRP